MKSMVLPSLLLLLLVVACGDDEVVDAAVTVDSPAPVDSAAPIDAASAIDSAPSIDATQTAAPVITLVTWTHSNPCTAGVASNVVITVAATDSDTVPGNLSYSGSVSGCGSITSAMATVTCPQFAPYPGTVTVTDPENNADTVNFSVMPCTDGTAN